MSFLTHALVGNRIDAVWADSEVTYIMLGNGTQITIRGCVIVQPKSAQIAENGECARLPEECS